MVRLVPFPAEQPCSPVPRARLGAASPPCGIRQLAPYRPRPVAQRAEEQSPHERETGTRAKPASPAPVGFCRLWDMGGACVCAYVCSENLCRSGGRHSCPTGCCWFCVCVGVCVCVCVCAVMLQVRVCAVIQSVCVCVCGYVRVSA